MSTNGSAQALDPSEYIARHLQSFSVPQPVPAVAGHHAGFFPWNLYVLALAAGLFVLMAGVAALTDRRPLFRLPRSMSFGRRFYVWWSCAWRQWLASALLCLALLVGYHSLDLKLAAPLMKLSTALTPSGATALAAIVPGVIMALPLVAAVLVYVLLSLPLSGYMVRGGLAAHALPGPERLGLWHATLLGLTTYLWSVPGSLLIAELIVVLPHHVEDGLRAMLLVIWSMYIVLPRQLRRVARLAAPLH
ncbi:hypothetical protein [Paraburkholderia acidipaludis]|uniref:hypothetical protein n=1 Tax=Paraburkholderia acidipaludis TaxID=660537 RepID=UPI0006937F1B|nr:hypothetical protein [Paraburkholderia acidipaludis]